MAFYVLEKNLKKRPREKQELENIGRKCMKLEQGKIKYEDVRGLHELWKGYISGVVSGGKSEDGLAKADYHGALLLVTQSPNPSQVSLSGILIRETRHTFILISTSDRLLKMQLKVAIFGLLVGWVSGNCWEERCKVSSDSLRFLLMGDWGGLPIWPYHSYGQTRVANSLGKMAETEKTQFQLALGDNFYLLGVSDENDARFKRTFEDVYTADSLQTPWYVIAGNHDHYGNVSGEIAYTKKSHRWNFPRLYYTVQYELEDGSEVDIVMIDTVSLVGDTRDIRLASYWDYYTAEEHEPRGPDDVAAAEDQWAWIEHTLAASKAKYVIVAGHYPVYSISEHGPTKPLVDRLLPMLEKYKVNAYLCGHDHNLQHLTTEKNGWTTNLIVAGAGGFLDTSERHYYSVPKGSLKFHYAGSSHVFAKVGFTNGAFIYANLFSNGGSFDFYGGGGKLLYKVGVKPRN